jgi:hypothetical protein
MFWRRVHDMGVNASTTALQTRGAVHRSRPRVVHAGAFVGALWAAALATQYVAARLAYHPHLGPWIYRASTGARHRFSLIIPVCLVVGGLVLLTRRWRWSVVPLLLSAETAHIARDAPVYSPVRVFVWYRAYHSVPAYRQLFLVAWAIFATAAVAATIAVARLAAAQHELTPTAPRKPDHQFDPHTIN